MMKDRDEKWLLVITDKGCEQIVFNNTSLKPSITKIEKNVKILVFTDTKEAIDKLYGKLKPIESEQELSLFVGKMIDKDMPGGLNEILDGLKADGS